MIVNIITSFCGNQGSYREHFATHDDSTWADRPASNSIWIPCRHLKARDQGKLLLKCDICSDWSWDPLFKFMMFKGKREIRSRSLPSRCCWTFRVKVVKKRFQWLPIVVGREGGAFAKELRVQKKIYSAKSPYIRTKLVFKF